MLLSLSLNESGVEADNEDLDGRDIAMDRDERSRTWHFMFLWRIRRKAEEERNFFN